MSSRWQYQDSASTPDLIKKKVHFQENEEHLRNDESATSLQTLFNDRDNCTSIGKYLQISPAHELLFSSNALYKNECCSVPLLLTNISDGDVAYKVRTTSPLSYRVRPSMGLVRPKTTAEVMVHLSKGSPGRSIVHDKFLVMAMPVELNRVDADITAEMNELWHRCPKDKVAEHKIRCGLLPETPPAGAQDTAIGELFLKMDALSTTLRNEILSLRRHLYVVAGLYLVLLTLVLLFVHFNGWEHFFSSGHQMDSCLDSGRSNHRPV